MSQGVFSERWYLGLNPFLHFPSAGFCILLEEEGTDLSWGVSVPLGGCFGRALSTLSALGQIPGQGTAGEGHKGIVCELGQNHQRFKQHRLPQTLLQTAAIQGGSIFSLYIFCT